MQHTRKGFCLPSGRKGWVIEISSISAFDLYSPVLRASICSLNEENPVVLGVLGWVI